MGTEQDVLPDLAETLATLGRGSLVAKIERLEAENQRLVKMLDHAYRQLGVEPERLGAVK